MEAGGTNIFSQSIWSGHKARLGLQHPKKWGLGSTKTNRQSNLLPRPFRGARFRKEDMRIRVQCEVCGKGQVFDAAKGLGEALKAADAEGWDTAYSPLSSGCLYGLVSPRTCPECSLTESTWFALEGGRSPAELSDRQQRALARMLAEPFSLVEFKGAFEGGESFAPAAIESNCLYLAEFKDSKSMLNRAAHAHNEFRHEHRGKPGVLYLAKWEGDTVFRWHPLGSNGEPDWLMGITSTDVRASSVVEGVAKIMTLNTRYSFAVSKAIRLSR